jgi:hypothetical protein
MNALDRLLILVMPVELRCTVIKMLKVASQAKLHQAANAGTTLLSNLFLILI